MLWEYWANWKKVMALRNPVLKTQFFGMISPSPYWHSMFLDNLETYGLADPTMVASFLCRTCSIHCKIQCISPVKTNTSSLKSYPSIGKGHPYIHRANAAL